jgi:hypothetical protein
MKPTLLAKIEAYPVAWLVLRCPISVVAMFLQTFPEPQAPVKVPKCQETTHKAKSNIPKRHIVDALTA